MLLLCFALLPHVVRAQQGYPEPIDLYINDFANIIHADDAAEVCVLLTHLWTVENIEATVVTIDSFRDYTREDIGFEAFTTNLFNYWGVGDSARNDGIMLLVATGDRKVRIELGAGYSPAADEDAQQIINKRMLPSLREEVYSKAILKGVQGIADMLDTAPSANAFCQRPEDVQPFSPLATPPAIGAQPASPLTTGQNTVGLSSAPTRRPTRTPFVMRQNESNRTTNRGRDRGSPPFLVFLFFIVVGINFFLRVMGVDLGSDSDDDRNSSSSSSWSSSSSSRTRSSSGNRSSSSRSSSSFSGGRSSSGGASGSW